MMWKWTCLQSRTDRPEWPCLLSPRLHEHAKPGGGWLVLLLLVIQLHLVLSYNHGLAWNLLFKALLLCLPDVEVQHASMGHRTSRGIKQGIFKANVVNHLNSTRLTLSLPAWVGVLWFSVTLAHAHSLSLCLPHILPPFSLTCWFFSSPDGVRLDLCEKSWVCESDNPGSNAATPFLVSAVKQVTSALWMSFFLWNGNVCPPLVTCEVPGTEWTHHLLPILSMTRCYLIPSCWPLSPAVNMGWKTQYWCVSQDSPGSRTNRICIYKREAVGPGKSEIHRGGRQTGNFSKSWCGSQKAIWGSSFLLMAPQSFQLIGWSPPIQWRVICFT